MNGAVEQQLPRTSVNQTQVARSPEFLVRKSFADCYPGQVSQTLLASVPSSVPLRSQGRGVARRNTNVTFMSAPGLSVYFCVSRHPSRGRDVDAVA